MVYCIRDKLCDDDTLSDKTSKDLTLHEDFDEKNKKIFIFVSKNKNLLAFI
jgi:hypothetical protein